MVTSFDVTTKATRSAGWKALPLDPTLFRMLDSERAFFKAQTGIQSDEELQDHIVKIQEAAYSVIPYPCIRLFSFLRLNITRRVTYQKTLKLGKERSGAIFLEVGAGFGTDSRKLISDGYPVENVVVNDLHNGLWNAGHKLFKTTPESYPATFILGDFFQITEGIGEAPLSNRPNLASLNSLAPLKGQVSAIYTALFFHLFEEHRGNELAKRLALLLSPEKGSLIFGLHLGSPEAVLQTTPAGTMFCHSPNSWKKMWGEVFPLGDVIIEAEIVPAVPSSARAYAGENGASNIWLLIWSIERL